MDPLHTNIYIICIYNTYPADYLLNSKFRGSTKLISIFRKRTTLFNLKQDIFRE